MSGPVTFDVERPAAFGRVHVVLRVLLLVVLSWIGHPFGLLWLGLPIAAAILVSQQGGEHYLDRRGPAVTRVLHWIVAFAAYVALLTDDLNPDAVRFEVARSGSPTAGSALLRILYAIPSIVVLAIAAFVGAIVWMVAAIWILLAETYPESLWRFLRALVRWDARLLAYLASLVERYPGFAR